MKKLLKSIALSSLIFVSIAFSNELDNFNLKALKRAIEIDEVHKVVEQLNLSKREQHREDVSSYILQLWDERLESNAEALKNDLVVISIADFLSQATNNDLIEFDVIPLLELARTEASSKNRRVASEALSILGRSGKAEDIDTLISVIKNTNSEYLFNASVISISSKCDSSLNNRLLQLDGMSRKKKSYIKESLDEFNSAICQSL